MYTRTIKKNLFDYTTIREGFDLILAIDFTKLFEDHPDTDDGNNELARLFRTLPNHIKNIQSTSTTVEISEERLKKLLIHVPFSVETITVTQTNGNSSTRTINLDQYRKDNYFPDSYRDISDSAKIALLIIKLNYFIKPEPFYRITQNVIVAGLVLLCFLVTGVTM